jgi:crotonobetainyl-CoA:carnitine CoA-transferase CaiB-like acyl-CoA transferase
VEIDQHAAAFYGELSVVWSALAGRPGWLRMWGIAFPTGAAVGLLSGISIVDITDSLAGALATQVLADCGARIVRVDLPGTVREPGDLVRLRGRRSIAIDLSRPEGLALAEDLVAASDVLLIDPQFDGTSRFPAPYTELAKRSERLIVCRISGYGDEGPLTGAPAHEHLVAARYGVYDQPGWRPGPTFLPAPVPSLGAALLAVQAIGTALYMRERHGRGQEVTTSLLAGALALEPGIVSVENPLTGVAAAPRSPRGFAPLYSLYECADGEWLHFACLSIEFQERAMRTLGIEEELRALGFGTPAMREHQAEIIEIIAAKMKQRPFAEWAGILEAADVPYARSQHTEDLLADPQVAHQGLLVEVDDPTVGRMWQMGAVLTVVSSPEAHPEPAPLAGQHTDEVCRELGLTNERIAALRASRVIA